MTPWNSVAPRHDHINGIQCFAFITALLFSLFCIKSAWLYVHLRQRGRNCQDSIHARAPVIQRDAIGHIFFLASGRGICFTVNYSCFFSENLVRSRKWAGVTVVSWLSLLGFQYLELQQVVTTAQHTLHEIDIKRQTNKQTNNKIKSKYNNQSCKDTVWSFSEHKAGNAFISSGKTMKQKLHEYELCMRGREKYTKKGREINKRKVSVHYPVFVETLRCKKNSRLMEFW